ncbi:ABC-2 transporter permease [Emticicia fontis]
MKGQIQAIRTELIKSKNVNILWVSFIAFGLAPIMGGIFMLMMRDPKALEKAGSFNAKAQAMNFAASWDSYFMILTQAVGVGGIMVFGFVASWIFGREYSEGTAKDLLALPTSRTQIINAKFFVYLLWCLALAIANVLIAYLIGTILQIAPFQASNLSAYILDYLITTLLTILLGTPIAFFAIWGKGYLAPLGFVALALVFAQIIAATGYGTYFPWAVPGIFSGASGIYRLQLNIFSYLIVFLTSVAGYVTSIFYWKYADQTS